MGGWRALICCATCATGVLSFLRVVASAVRRSEQFLVYREAAERKAARLREEARVERVNAQADEPSQAAHFSEGRKPA